VCACECWCSLCMLATACTQQQKKPTIARTVGCSRWHFMSAAHAPVVQNCKIANTSLGQQITPSVLVGQQSVSKGLARTIRLKVYTVHIRYFLAGKLPYIRSYTVYIRYFLAGKSPYIRSYTVCIYGVCAVFFGREITIHTVIYIVYIRCIYGIFWQGNHHTYGHIRCVYTVLANPYT
jgi:hypothetical protein